MNGDATLMGLMAAFFIGVVAGYLVGVVYHTAMESLSKALWQVIAGLKNPLSNLTSTGLFPPLDT